MIDLAASVTGDVSPSFQMGVKNLANSGWKIALYLAGMAFSITLSRAQARVDGTGRPLLVMDDSLGYVTAKLIYKSPGEEYYVPDLTRTDWIRSRYQQFAASGSVTVYVYSYHLISKGLHGNVVDISLEKKTVSIYDFANPKAPPTVLPLNSSYPPFMAAINLKILPLVKREMLAYHQSLFGSPPPPVGTYSPAIH